MGKIHKQCAEYGLPIEAFSFQRQQDSKLWIGEDLNCYTPEQVVLNSYLDAGYEGSWCEGGTLLHLMKSACFPILVKYNTFSCREDARRRYFEGQCTILSAHHDEILSTISSATISEIEKYSTEIVEDKFIQEWFPRVSAQHIIRLWNALGSNLLTEIARIFLSQPYDYRAGWPDLTLIRGQMLRFVEVKTTDSLHASQLRIVNAFSKSLSLNFSVAHVILKR